MTTFIGISKIDHYFEHARETRNRHGNRTREILVDVDRYEFDFTLDRRVWTSLDTAEDASWFGCWVAKSLRAFLIYAEGDLRFTQADDDDSFDRELAALCAFHEEAPYMMAIGEEGATAFYQDRSELFIDSANLPTGEAKENGEESTEPG